MIAACLGGWRSPFGGGKEKEEEKEGKGGKRKGRPSTLGFQSGSFGFLFYLSLNFMFFVRRCYGNGLACIYLLGFAVESVGVLRNNPRSMM